MIVIDCSYALALVMPEELRPRSVASVVAERFIAPAIWPIEVASAMRNSMRRGRLLHRDVTTLCTDLDEFEVLVVATAHSQPQLHFDAALTHDLTPYDASYLELAIQRRCALATLDTSMAAAAQRAGLKVHC